MKYPCILPRFNLGQLGVNGGTDVVYGDLRK